MFENYCIQEGHYVHIRDETAAPQAEEGEEMVGGEEEEKLSPREGYPKGIVPVWRPRKILPYKLELIPRDPKLPPKPPASEAGEEQLPEGEELEEALPEGEEGLPEGEEGNRGSETGSARQRESLKGNEELMPIQEESSPENMSPRTDTDNPEDTSPELTGNEDYTQFSVFVCSRFLRYYLHYKLSKQFNVDCNIYHSNSAPKEA